MFATAQGESTRVTDAQDGAHYVARVDKVMPSALRPLAEVRDKAIAGWQAEQKQKDAAKRAEALAAAVTPSTPLATVAAEKRVTVQSGVTLGRTPEPDSRTAGARHQAVRGQARRGGVCRRRIRRLCGAAERRAGAADNPG